MLENRTGQKHATSYFVSDGIQALIFSFLPPLGGYQETEATWLTACKQRFTFHSRCYEETEAT